MHRIQMLTRAVALLAVLAFTGWIGTPPALSQPALSQPALSQPALSQPALSQPALSQPALSQPALSQPANQPNNWRMERHKVERVWADTIVELAKICEQQGLAAEARETLAWYQFRDPERTYIFLPGEEGLPAIEEGLRGQWQTRLQELRREHGARIFELARRAANAGDGTEAFRFLNEVLYYDPDQAAVREMLGHRKTDDGWRVASDRMKDKIASAGHPTMNWAPKTWLSVSTPHFNIASLADKETTLLLAEKLERWQDVWRQVFFEFHSRPDAVARWIEGNGQAPTPSKKFDVVFFADKQQYVDQLSSSVPGIEYSEGYYNDSTKTSYIFASDKPGNHDTWRHELTHQLFQETIRTQADPFEDGYIWLGEGIAMYFESLVDHGGYVTLGGFDSRRIQFARIRKFREGFAVQLSEIANVGRAAFQQREDQALLYSQSAGIAHMLMDHNQGGHQKQLATFIKLLYQGKLKPDTFEQLIGSSFAQIEDEYTRFLDVESEQVEKYLMSPGMRTELALPSADLSADAFARIGACTNLRWLDLTENPVTGNLLAPLDPCDQLDQLFLTKCMVDAGTFAALQNLDGLQELDLSGSSVTDEELSLLGGIRNLTILRLAHTRTTDRGLQSIAALTNLKTVDLGGSQVTDGGANWLKSQRPDLEINR